MTEKLQQRPVVILLAEDDPADQALTRRALAKSRMRYDLRVVADGEEAMDFLCQRNRYSEPGSSPRPDLLLLDLNMPRLDGRQVMAQMQANPALKDIAVVVLTTSNRPEDLEQCRALGCRSYITKPSGMNQFVELIRTLEEYWLPIVVLPRR